MYLHLHFQSINILIFNINWIFKAVLNYEHVTYELKNLFNKASHRYPICGPSDLQIYINQTEKNHLHMYIQVLKILTVSITTMKMTCIMFLDRSIGYKWLFCICLINWTFHHSIYEYNSSKSVDLLMYFSHVFAPQLYCVKRSNLWMGLLSNTSNCGVGIHQECRERLPRHLGLAIPTCITACRDACRYR